VLARKKLALIFCVYGECRDRERTRFSVRDLAAWLIAERKMQGNLACSHAVSGFSIFSYTANAAPGSEHAFLFATWRHGSLQSAKCRVILRARTQEAGSIILRIRRMPRQGTQKPRPTRIHTRRPGLIFRSNNYLSVIFLLLIMAADPTHCPQL